MTPSSKSPIAQAVTLLEVAREAKVSPSTVSRYLNGTAKIANDKRSAVEAAIQKLNFKPNLAARSLKTGSTMTIGVLTQAVDSPFYAFTLRGVETGLADSGYAPIMVSGQWSVKEEIERIHVLMSRKIDGLVILAGLLDDEAIAQLAKQIPVVVTGRNVQVDHVRCVYVDQELCGFMATEHLIRLGHRDIAFIAGPPDFYDAQMRLAGYQRALAEAGIAFDLRRVAQGDFQERTGELAMNALIKSQISISAVFAANDQTAFGARVSLFRHGLSVPDDVSLIGVDDLPAAAYSIPPMSSIHQSGFEMGLYAAHSLLEMLGRRIEKAAWPSLSLVVRESTAKYSK